MRARIFTEKEQNTLTRFTGGSTIVSKSERAFLSTLKRRIRLYYPKLRRDMNMVELARATWRKEVV